MYPEGPANDSPYRVRGVPLNFRSRPPGRPTTKKVFPQFLKNLRGGVQIFACGIRGPPRPIGDKMLATVPWPTSSERNSEISTTTFHSSRRLHSRDVGSFLTDLKYSQLITDPPKSLGPLLSACQSRSHHHQTLQAPVSIKPLVFYHPPCISIHSPPC